MELSKINYWMQVIGIFAVVASLIFVGLELQQSRQIALADVFQQRAGLAIQVQQGSYGDTNYQEILFRHLEGEPVSQLEVGMLQFRQNPWFSYWENSYFQYKIGLLSEATWQSSRNTIKQRLSSPIYQEWWERERENWKSDFAQEVDNVLLEIKSSK